MRIDNLFSELKRRNVYKSAVAYLVIAWLFIQAASILLPTFDAPSWLMKALVVLLALGFVLAVFIAWAFEMTPQGMKRTEDVSPDEAIPQWSRRKYFALITGVAVLAAGLLAYQLLRGPILAPTPGANDKSIAVLPFGNLSRDPENEYFADGIQDEIITRLAQVSDLKVISCTSTRRYKGTSQNLRQIAGELGVTNILEGSVQKANDQVHVNVQLINALTDTHLWADIYDRKLIDVFVVESEIAKTIADQLRAKLTGRESEAIAARPTENNAAHELYLKGRYFWNKRTANDLRKALSYFEASAKMDPNYALTYAGLADTWVLLPLYNAVTPSDGFPKAKEAANKAIALDPNLAEPHAALGLIANTFDFDFARSLQEFETSIKLNSNYATAHHWFGNSVLPCLGNFERAIAELKRAAELDPLSVIINVDLGNGYFYTGQYNAGIAQMRKALELDPNFYYAHYNLGTLLEASGDLPGAISEYEKAMSLEANDPWPMVLLARAQALSGRRDVALKTLAQLKESAKQRYVSDYEIGIVYLGLNDRPQALQWFEKSYADRQPDLNTIRFDPFLKPLHGDKRFEALAEKILPARVLEELKKK